MKFAVTRDKLNSIPETPKTKLDQKPRSYFKEDEYSKLWRAAIKLGNKKYTHALEIKGVPTRYLYYTRELSDFIVFSTNVFVRLSDAKDLKHKHVSIVAGTETALEITPPHSKTVSKTSMSMPIAVKVYRRLVQRHQAEGKGVGPDDYIFYPEYRNRTYALDNLRRLFNHLLQKTDLKTDAFGTPRTLYSLRHTALMYRFLYMDPPDIFLIARNALTSVEMLEKFYLSHADTRMKLTQLQSKKKL